MQFDFEWDPAKARLNQAKHGVGFDEAATVFSDPRMLTVYDDEHSTDQEDRWITLGISAKGRLLVVCHTYWEATVGAAVIRVFSGRRATKRETERYVVE